LRYQVDEIDAAALKHDEEETLEQRAKQLRYGERILQQIARAAALLSESDINANDLLAEAAESLRSVAKYHPDVAALSQELADTLASLQATTDTLSEFAADFELEPGELERVEARLTLLETLKSKYGATVTAVLAYCQEAAAELERLEHADADVSILQDEHNALTERLRELAAHLSAARQQSAQHLAEQVSRELQPLGMPHAQFMVEVTPQERLLSYGSDEVRFTFSANLGEPLAPLAQVASGGELSRVMLALNVVTGTDSPTLIFDEIDAGIGGQTARAVGRLLATLARDHQVLVVTHLAQVAAFADKHFVVEKQQQDGRTTTNVRQLDKLDNDVVSAIGSSEVGSDEAMGSNERERELARMLSGSVSDTARAHARELLAERNTLLPTPS
jgi:DNA repair protein RecN (Recombination protein N)